MAKYQNLLKVLLRLHDFNSGGITFKENDLILYYPFLPQNSYWKLT